MPYENLITIGGTPFLVTSQPASDVAQLVLDLTGDGMLVRVVRARKSRTVESLFNEVSAALQFPLYFGDNWAAFDECLADLEWLGFDRPIAVIVTDADECLLESEDLPVLVRIISEAANGYARPITDGQPWDRDAVAFHVVLQSLDGAARWKDAGAIVDTV